MVPEKSEEEGETTVAPSSAVDYVYKYGIIVGSVVWGCDNRQRNYDSERASDVQE
jgi:hypothetical protein